MENLNLENDEQLAGVLVVNHNTPERTSILGASIQFDNSRVEKGAVVQLN